MFVAAGVANAAAVAQQGANAPAVLSVWDRVVSAVGGIAALVWVQGPHLWGQASEGGVRGQGGASSGQQKTMVTKKDGDRKTWDPKFEFLIIFRAIFAPGAEN